MLKRKSKYKKQSQAIPSTQKSTSIFSKLLIAIVLGLIGVVLYAPSSDYDFVYDDDAVIKDNRYVKAGIAGLGKIWTTSYFKGMNEAINARAFRPVPLTTLAIELELFDKKPKTARQQINWTPNPAIYHKTNLLYYGLTGFFLFLLLVRLLKDYHIVLPIIITLLFVVHPIHVEVIANIKSRDTMLGFFNLCIALTFLLKSVDKQKLFYFVPALFFYFVALFSKEEIITSLAVIPMMLYFFRTLEWKKTALYSTPFFAAVAIYLLIRSSIVGGLNAGVELNILDNSLLATNGFAERSASNLQVLGYYLLHTVFPHPLLSDYSYSTLPNINWNTWQPYVALIANLGLVAAMIYGFRKKALYSFGILYYFATISIFTSLVITNVSAYNDRFLYSPVLGILFVIGWGIYKLMKVKNENGNFEKNISKLFSKNILPLSIAALLAIAGMVKVSSHLPVWKDRYALFAHDVKHSPNNARMLKNYGGSLARLAMEAPKGSDERKAYAEEGIQVLEKSLSIFERIPTGWVHIANCYAFLGDYNKSENAYRKALEFNPGNHYATVNLANILYRKRKYQESVDMLEQHPKTYFTKNDYNLLSLGHERLGNNEAAAKYRKLAQ